MHVFQNAQEKWWQKPLVLIDGEVLPAELAVLQLELRNSEEGVWINSRGLKPGVSALKQVAGTFQTIRKPLPDAVSRFLAEMYESTDLMKGCPDLVIWNTSSGKFRFVEVKCPLWDRPSKEQADFIDCVRARGIEAEIVEWIFEEDR